MSKLNYKPTEAQDECFGDIDKDGRITVLIRYEAQGKVRKYYRTEGQYFYSAEELEKFIKKNKIKVLPEKKFRASPMEGMLHLMKAV